MFAILDHTRRRDASSRRTRLVAAAATAGAVVAIGAMQLSGAQNAALAPLAGGPQTGTSRMDGSLPEWTRSVDEETRRRVAAVLEAALRDGDEKVRETAQKALDAIGDPSRGTVVVSSPCRGNCIFGNPHISVALDIRAAIVEIETRLALVEMQRGGSEARKRSLALLVGRTESSAAALATLLQDRDPQIRTLAALHLDSVVYPPAIPGWIALLGDKDDSLRERAAISLGAIGDPSAIDELTLTLLNDQSPDVRRQAAHSLGLIAAGGDRG